MATAKDLDNRSFVTEPQNQLECPICLETFKKPKCLPCLHTFCETCLHEYIETTHSDKEPVTFPCPCCRKELMGPSPGIPLKEWASKFPLNRFVISMMHSQTVPETKIQHCGPCERDEDTVVANYWCCQCEDAFCDTCLKYHGRKKKNKSHKIVPIKDVEKEPSEVATEEGCKDHEGSDLIYYCKDHELLCCKLCLLSTHQACEIHTFEEMAEIDPGLFDVEKMLKDLNDLDERAKLALISQKNRKEELYTTQTNLKDRVNKLVAVAKLKLDECQNRFNCNLDKVYGEKAKQLTENENKIKNFRKIISFGQNLLTDVKEKDDLTQKLKNIEKTKAQIREEIKKIKSVADGDQITEINLNVSDIFEKLGNLESVGELEIQKYETGQCVIKPLLNAADIFSNQEQQNPEIEKINLVKIFEITTNESNRWFTGGVFLKDDCLLFADNRNKKLRLYNSSGKLKCDHQLNYRPWDVTVGRAPNKVLVSDTESAYIRTYTISETGITEGYSIRVSKAKIGIDTSGDQIVCTDRETVDVVNYSGYISISLQIKCPNFVCSSKSKKKFYCSYGNAVSCYTLAGKKVSVYSHPELKNPSGLAIDNYDNVFICCIDSCNIHIVNAEGKQSAVILAKNFGKVTQPNSIAFNSTGEKLFITSYRERDPIEIYKIKYD